MKYLALSLFASLAVGCARSPSAPVSPRAVAPMPSALVSGPLALPVDGGSGEPREVRVLFDDPAGKVATIVLRDGTVLPEHHADVPVTIVALAGAGTVVSGEARLALDGTHAVVLAAGAPHAVEPAAGTTLVLLVHHLGRGAEHHR